MCEQTTTTPATQVEPDLAAKARHDAANAEQNRRAREWLIANGHLPGPVPATPVAPAQDAGAA